MFVVLSCFCSSSSSSPSSVTGVRPERGLGAILLCSDKEIVGHFYCVRIRSLLEIFTVFG